MGVSFTLDASSPNTLSVSVSYTCKSAKGTWQMIINYSACNLLWSWCSQHLHFTFDNVLVPCYSTTCLSAESGIWFNTRQSCSYVGRGNHHALLLWVKPCCHYKGHCYTGSQWLMGPTESRYSGFQRTQGSVVLYCFSCPYEFPVGPFHASCLWIKIRAPSYSSHTMPACLPAACCHDPHRDSHESILWNCKQALGPELPWLRCLVIQVKK